MATTSMPMDPMMPTTMMPMDNGTNAMGDGMMQMSFFFGDFKLLFATWMVNNGAELFGAMAAMFFLTIALEALKAFREWLQGWTLARYVKVEGESGDTKKPEGQNSSTRMFVMVKKRDIVMPVLMHVIQSILYTIQVGVTYILMLAVMSYNGGIFLAVCIGAGFGYLLFGWVSVYIGERTKREQAGYCH